jgi:hypothetical protein
MTGNEADFVVAAGEHPARDYDAGLAALRRELIDLETRIAAVLELHHTILRTYFGSHFR